MTQVTLPPDTRKVGYGNPPADINLIVDALKAMLATGYVTPSGDTSGATDFANITAALAVNDGAATLGPGMFWTSNMIALPAGARLRGVSRYLSVIKQAAGANLDAVVADAGWLSASGSPVSVSPVSVIDVGIDGNAANQTGGQGIGLATLTFWNNIHNLEIRNTYGDGLRLSSYTQAGNKITGSAVENHVFRVDVRAAGGYGIRVFDTTPSGTQEYTDGWIRDCIIQAPGLDGIRVDDSEGWLVAGNHLYGCTQHGIHMGRAANTRVTGNFIETWGSSASVGTYAAIAIGDGAASFIGGSDPIAVTGNVAFFGHSVAGGTVIYGILYAVASGATGNIAITGNSLLANGFFTAIHGNHQSGTAASNAMIGPNQVTGWAADWTPPASGTCNALVIDPNGMIMPELGSAPGTPAGGGRLYVSSDGHLHYLGPSGTDTALAAP